MSEHLSSIPVLELFNRSEVSRNLDRYQEHDTREAIERGLSIGDYDLVFAALTELAEKPGIPEVMEIIESILNLFERDKDSDLAVQAEQFREEIRSIPHPSRETRYQLALARHTSRLGSEYQAQYHERRPTFQGTGTFTDPLVSTMETRIYPQDAMLFSLLERHGEPVYLKSVRPNSSEALYELDGLNDAHTQILQPVDKDPFAEYKDREHVETKQYAPPLDLLKLAESSRFSNFITKLNLEQSGKGTFDQPYENKELWNHPELSMVAAFVKSAQMDKPIIFATNGVVLEANANFMSIRYLEGSAYPPMTQLQTLNADEGAKALIQAQLAVLVTE